MDISISIDAYRASIYPLNFRKIQQCQAFFVKLLKINKSKKNKKNTFALKYDFRKVFLACHENLP